MKRIISEEEKLRMVRMVKDGTPIPEVCKQEGVSRSALYQWMQLYEGRTRCSGKTINLQQVYQMERRLATLEEEIQIFNQKLFSLHFCGYFTDFLFRQWKKCRLHANVCVARVSFQGQT